MDEGRAKDLERIEKRLNTNKRLETRQLVTTGYNPLTGAQIQQAVTSSTYNAKADRFGKEQAQKAKSKIMRQVKDKQLTKLRNQLIRAVKAGDKQAELHITARIKRHERQHFEDYT